MANSHAVPVETVEVLAYTVPTDGPDGKEADGTLEWESTTCVVVLVSADGHTGLGYTYGEPATAALIAAIASAQCLHGVNEPQK